MAHALLHCVELLLLLIGQHRFNLAVRILHDRAGLGAAIILRERLVLEERLKLLLPINQYRLDLALLVGRQTECLRHVLQLPVRIHAPWAACARTRLRLIWRWWCRFLGKDAAYAQRERAAQRESEKSGLHEWMILRGFQRVARTFISERSRRLFFWRKHSAEVPFTEIDAESYDWMRRVLILVKKQAQDQTRKFAQSKKRAARFGSGEASRNWPTRWTLNRV
jgi:hypothetical protein